MKTRALIFVAVIILAFSMAALAAGGDKGAPATKAPAVAPADAVKAFYKFHFAHDMAFTQKNVDARKAWLSPGLLGLLSAELKKPVKPDDVPDIEGDPFTDSQEYPSSFQVGEATVQADKASVPVTFVWPAEKKGATVKLIIVSGEWRIDDILFDGDEPLRETLSPSQTEPAKK